MLRKAAPYLFFLLLGAVFVVLRPAYQTVFDWFYHVGAPAGPAATGAEIEAAKAAGGWVPSGTVGSKFIVFAAVYLLMAIWPWLVQWFTHPAPTRWQKERYSAEFKQLTVLEKLASVRAIQQNNVWRAIGAAIFAALVV